MTEEQLKVGREIVARLAEEEDEVIFAGEVRAGCWDHRNDVQSAARSPETFMARVIRKIDIGGDS